MELNTVYFSFGMAQSHDEAGGGLRGVHQQLMFTVLHGNEGIVPRELQPLALLMKHACSVVVDLNGDAVNGAEG